MFEVILYAIRREAFIYVLLFFMFFPVTLIKYMTMPTPFGGRVLQIYRTIWDLTQDERNTNVDTYARQ